MSTFNSKIRKDGKNMKVKKVNSLACKHCRRRKRKCGGDVPCDPCVKLNIKCEPVIEDNRGLNIFQFNFLKHQNKHLIEFINSIKNCNDVEKRSELINNFKIEDDCKDNDLTFNQNRKDFNTKSNGNVQVHAITENARNDVPAIYGPSYFYVPQISKERSDNETGQMVDFENFQNDQIINLIMNFFV